MTTAATKDITLPPGTVTPAIVAFCAAERIPLAGDVISFPDTSQAARMDVKLLAKLLAMGLICGASPTEPAGQVKAVRFTADDLLGYQSTPATAQLESLLAAGDGEGWTKAKVLGLIDESEHAALQRRPGHASEATVAASFVPWRETVKAWALPATPPKVASSKARSDERPDVDA